MMASVCQCWPLDHLPTKTKLPPTTMMASLHFALLVRFNFPQGCVPALENGQSERRRKGQLVVCMCGARGQMRLGGEVLLVINWATY